MSINVKLPDVQKLVDKILAQKTKALRKWSEDYIHTIKTRANSGQGFAGKWPKYSAAYAKRKERSGRKSSPVDLAWSGDMKKAIHNDEQETPEAIEVRIFVSPDQAEKARGNQAKRPFMGVGSKDKQELLDKLRKA